MEMRQAGAHRPSVATITGRYLPLQGVRRVMICYTRTTLCSDTTQGTGSVSVPLMADTCNLRSA